MGFQLKTKLQLTLQVSREKKLVTIYVKERSEPLTEENKAQLSEIEIMPTNMIVVGSYIFTLLFLTRS